MQIDREIIFTVSKGEMNTIPLPNPTRNRRALHFAAARAHTRQKPMTLSANVVDMVVFID